MSELLLEGVHTALVTPFRNNALDFGFGRHNLGFGGITRHALGSDKQKEKH